ncbi:MAG: phosphate transport system substrate-binding protein [Pseudomonadota bacterium]|nr:phosphate transport system substrate-binding protein [Pseudomonadota bacterium]
MFSTSVITRAILLVAALFSGLTLTVSTAEELKIGGTGNALGTMQRLADAFNPQNPDVKATVLPSMGSSGAVKAVPKGAIDIGLSSRDFTLALILSENRPLRALILNGVEPTVENTATGRYPYHKRLFLITRAEPTAKVQQFKAFLDTPTGRDILAGTGCWIP